MIKDSEFKEKDNDFILRHFILAGLFLLDALINIFRLTVTATQSIKKSSKRNRQKLLNQAMLQNKSKKDLEKVLDEINILSNMNKDELVTLVQTNEEALGKIKLKDRKNELMRMTNNQLRSLTNTKDKIYKLRKSELVELILNDENKNNPIN